MCTAIYKPAIVVWKRWPTTFVKNIIHESFWQCALLNLFLFQRLPLSLIWMFGLIFFCLYCCCFLVVLLWGEGEQSRNQGAISVEVCARKLWLHCIALLCSFVCLFVCCCFFSRGYCQAVSTLGVLDLIWLQLCTMNAHKNSAVSAGENSGKQFKKEMTFLQQCNAMKIS